MPRLARYHPEIVHDRGAKILPEESPPRGTPAQTRILLSVERCECQRSFERFYVLVRPVRGESLGSRPPVHPPWGSGEFRVESSESRIEGSELRVERAGLSGGGLLFRRQEWRLRRGARQDSTPLLRRAPQHRTWQFHWKPHVSKHSYLLSLPGSEGGRWHR